MTAGADSVRGGYERSGFVLRRSLLPGDVIRPIAAIGERVHARWMEEHGDEARRLDLVNSTGLTLTRYFPRPFEHERKVLFDALASDELSSLIADVFGDDLYFHGTQMFFNPAGGRRRPYWHRDVQYLIAGEAEQRALLGELCHLHVRIPLRAELGFALVPGSHARWDGDLERDVRLERAGHRSSEDLPSATMLDLAPGDVLVFSAHMLHRGTYEGNDDRLSLDLMLGRPHRRITAAPDPDELPTAEELASIRNRGWYERARELRLAARTG